MLADQALRSGYRGSDYCCWRVSGVKLLVLRAACVPVCASILWCICCVLVLDLLLDESCLWSPAWCLGMLMNAAFIAILFTLVALVCHPPVCSGDSEYTDGDAVSVAGFPSNNPMGLIWIDDALYIADG